MQEQLTNLTQINQGLQSENQKLNQQINTLQDVIKISQDEVDSQKHQPSEQITASTVKVKKPKNELILFTQELVTVQKQESNQLLKIQKKIVELEQYLQEKDKVILEQETSLSELQDQIHEALKTEDSMRTQIRDKQSKIDDLTKQLSFLNQSWELKLEDINHQLQAKQVSLQDAWNLTSEKEIEIQSFMRQLREAETSLKEFRARNEQLEEEGIQYQQKYQENFEEMEQIKHDFESILNFKNELEALVEEQTMNIDQKNKKMLMLEETLRFKESDLEKKESLLRRMSQGADETKKKLAQAEMKLRQITQTTMRDLKTKLKDKLNEIEVLKEMVKSANKQAKAKDIDIQRLNKRIQRLEKMNELGKGIIQDGAQLPIDTSNPIMEDENELAETDTYITPLKQPPLPPYQKRGSDQLGLNPINYTNQRSVEEEVQMELLAAQQQRQFNIKLSGNGNYNSKNQLNQRNYKQKEIEEAMELDRMLEQERRNQSHDVFQKKYEEKLDQYYNNLSNAQQSNMKNHSTGMKGIFGGSIGETNETQRHNDSMRYYDGMLPNLNVSKKECNLI
ncbi:UNKNOWN [Stylonychia lemnae]|uniref:Uncharacterized protein n=1 Tax=Stylonychia lemnae TaxID=5949 RepID=A0A078AU49_STYLE|nr:UNKNOWN [Stylonychia lemnae]|eukprot:CDW85506.1 UNKNOWN [Stylonychia lemnae]